jgi:hypothetical protein
LSQAACLIGFALSEILRVLLTYLVGYTVYAILGALFTFVHMYLLGFAFSMIFGALDYI